MFEQRCFFYIDNEKGFITLIDSLIEKDVFIDIISFKKAFMVPSYNKIVVFNFVWRYEHETYA